MSEQNYISSACLRRYKLDKLIEEVFRNYFIMCHAMNKSEVDCFVQMEFNKSFDFLNLFFC